MKTIGRITYSAGFSREATSIPGNGTFSTDTIPSQPTCQIEAIQLADLNEQLNFNRQCLYQKEKI